MGRISIQNSGEYQSNSGSNYFQLKDDKDSAEVVFLYDDPTGSDIDYYLCHKCEIDGYERWVNCNAIDEDGNDHPSDCVLCQNNFPRFEKLFLQLFNLTDDSKQIWDRGSKFVGTISTFVERYGSLVNQPLEIVRNGRKGDQATTYQLFPTEADPDATVESYGGRDELLGSYILDLDENEMYDVIDGKYHMPNNNSSSASSNSNRRRSNSTRQATERRERTAPASRGGSARRSATSDGRSSMTERATTRERGTSVRGDSDSSEPTRRSSPAARRTSPRR